MIPLSAFLVAYTAGITYLSLLAAEALIRLLINLRRIRAEAEEARLRAPLPEARESLLPEGWPGPQRPLDMPLRHDTEALAAVPLQSRVRVFTTEAEPIVVELRVGGGRHRLGDAAGTSAQQARWNSPTGQFDLLVAATWSDDDMELLSREWWCEACHGDHRDCTGVCACPCTLVEVAA